MVFQITMSCLFMCVPKQRLLPWQILFMCKYTVTEHRDRRERRKEFIQNYIYGGGFLAARRAKIKCKGKESFCILFASKCL